MGFGYDVIMMIRALIVVVVVPLLASFASSGLYNMSDEWCARHVDASPARCPENQALTHRTADASTHGSLTRDQ